MFRLLGETGSHAPVLNDVVLIEPQAASTGETVPLPYAGGAWVVWDRADEPTTAVDDETAAPPGSTRRGCSARGGAPGVGLVARWHRRAMLALARQHALDRVQFGRPVASFQAVRHRLAETLVAIEGAEATLSAATDNLD